MPWVRNALHAGDKAPAAAWLIHGVHVALLCDLPQRTRWVNRNPRIFGSIATGVLSSPRPVFFGSLSISLDRPVTFDSSRRSYQRLQHDGHVLGMAAASRHPG